MNRKRYSTDVTDAQWRLIEAVLPLPKGGRSGRPPKYSRREMVNAMLYILRTGCSWRLLPHDFPPYGAVSETFGRWRDNGTIERIHTALRAQTREEMGREAAPSAAILDSQSVKTTEKGAQKVSTQARK
jgi:putative transposase